VKGHRSFGIAALALVSLLAANCSDNVSPPTTPPGGSGNGVAIRGNERIGWFQQAASSAALRDYRFTLYIDGNRNPLNDATCGQSAGSQGFECSASLPRMNAGRHVLEITTTHQTTQEESPRSGALVVMMMSQSIATENMAPAAINLPMACAGNQSRACYQTAVVMADAAVPRRLIALPDEAVLLLGARELTLVEDGIASLAHSMHDEPDPSGEFVDAAIDRAFGTTRFVYLAVAAEERGERMLRVARGRLVGGTLGELATVVVGLPLRADQRAVLETTQAGELLVGVPGTAIGLAERTGVVLRFASDGTSVDRRAGSRAFAQFNGAPTAVALDPSERLWIATAENSQPLSVVSDHAARAVNVGEAPVNARSGLQGLAFSSSANEAAAAFVLGGRPGMLYRASMNDEGSALRTWSAVQISDGGSYLEPRAFAISPRGDLFVAATSAQRDRAMLLRLRETDVSSNRQ
jgi:hypothetical protein